MSRPDKYDARKPDYSTPETRSAVIAEQMAEYEAVNGPVKPSPIRRSETSKLCRYKACSKPLEVSRVMLGGKRSIYCNEKCHKDDMRFNHHTIKKRV